MPTTQSILNASAKNFYIKEYECLRKEIEWLLKDYRELERNVVIAVGVTWAWLLDEESKLHVPVFAWLIPILFSLLGALRASGIMKSFGVFHAYIKDIEKAFVGTGYPDGWEHFFFREDLDIEKCQVILGTADLGHGRGGIVQDF